jgi:hypothetical protein
VVEHRLDGDVGLPGHVGDGHRVEAPLVEEPVGDPADLLTGLGLLARAAVEEFTHRLRVSTHRHCRMTRMY